MYVQLHSGLEMEAVTDQRAIEAKNETLPWMCRKIGKSYLGHLHSRPLIKFANTQVAQFTCSYNLVKYFARILDNNDDRKVDQTEFIDFFNLTKSELEGCAYSLIQMFLLPAQCILEHGWLRILHHNLTM